MNATPTVRRRAGVLPGGHGLRIAAAILTLVLAAAAGQGQGKGDDGDGKGDRKKSDEEVLFEAVAGEWKAGNVAGLAARFPEKRKVSLRLPGMEGGDYRAEQAKSLLEEYFSVRAFSKVELKAVRESTGTFEVEYVRAADRKRVKAELLLVLGAEGKRRVLLSARESP